MLVPTKHENLNKNILVVGSYIIEKISKKVKIIDMILEDYCKELDITDIDVFYNAMTFLYCIGAIEVSDNTVRLIKK